MNKIDAVITWVDGNDPIHIAKREQYGTQKMLVTDDVAGSTRYISVGEIFYCVASLNRFAPWLNKIYLVTDDQDPGLGDFLNKHFPEGHIPVEIVSHKTIFEGYERFLPTFNSITIESMTWRIPGLSEHYIEFNDDLILSAPVYPQDFFTPEGNPICYGKMYSSILVRISRFLKSRLDGRKAVTYKETMMNAASLLGYKARMLKVYHTPKALCKSFYQRYFEKHPQVLERNIRHRFRHYTQFNPQVLQYMALRRMGLTPLRRAYDNLLYLKPTKDDAYVQEKLRLFTLRNGYKFGCFNSLDQATEESRSLVIKWIEDRLRLNP